MREQMEPLRQAVQAGLNNGQKNIVVDLEVLAALLQIARPTYCEHFISEGEWCEECNRAMKEARIENEDF